MPAFFARGTYSPTFVEVVLGNKAPRVPRLSANCAINQRRAKPLSNRCPGCRGIAVQILVESLSSWAEYALGHGFWRVTLHFGFMNTPDVP